MSTMTGKTIPKTSMARKQGKKKEIEVNNFQIGGEVGHYGIFEKKQMWVCLG